MEPFPAIVNDLCQLSSVTKSFILDIIIGSKSTVNIRFALHVVVGSLVSPARSLLENVNDIFSDYSSVVFDSPDYKF